MISLIAQVADKVITILIFAIVIRTILSYFPKYRSHKLSVILTDVTDPLLKPFKRFQIASAAGPIDFSPIVAIILLNLIQSVIVRQFIF